MLVLTRKNNEEILLNDNITIKVLSVIGNRVRIGVDAPKCVRVLRGELTAHREVTLELDANQLLAS